MAKRNPQTTFALKKPTIRTIFLFFLFLFLSVFFLLPSSLVVAITAYFDQPYPSLFPNLGAFVDDFSASSVQQIVDHCLYDTINCSRPVNNMSKSRIYTMSMLFTLWNTRIKKHLLFSGVHQESLAANRNKYQSFEYKSGMDSGRNAYSSDQESIVLLKMKMIQIQVHLEEQQLDRFLYDGCGDTILIIFMVTVAALLALGIITKFFTGYTEDDEGKVEFITSKTSVKDAMDGVIKIFTIVASILNEKNDIRQSTCEMMGSATTICCDKTGTLTLNLAYICENKNDPPNDTSALPPKIVSLLVESVAHNTTDSVFSPKGGRDVDVSGSPTEKAILQWGVKLGMNFDVVRLECSVIYASPFNSEKKRGGVAVKRIIEDLFF
ncbi:hypothetical protein Lser_V15G33118 [Lactuca serriola]